MSTNSSLAWGILGAGSIAHAFARGIAKSRTGRLAAIGSRQLSSAREFAAQHGSVKAHGTYDALLADPEVQAVYISTPHPMHAEWCVKAARAGKHILCEKPLTLNHAEAMVVAEEARAHGVFLMEAFMYRCHPQMARLVELIRGGTIGEVGVIQATFSFKSKASATSRLFANALGGGGILDVGCYAMSVARLVAGAAKGQPFLDPTRVSGMARLHPETGTDLYALATAEFPGGMMAQLATGLGLYQEKGLRVFGTTGWIHMPSSFDVWQDGGDSILQLHREGGEKPESIVVTCADYLYAREADAVGDAIAAGLMESSYMPVADSLGNMRALDEWRASAGLVYESEKPSASFPTISGLPLAKRADAAMTYGTIAGVSLPVSRLVMGCDNQTTMPHATAMFDDFFERGGNVFDTAYVYGSGRQEHLVGRWLQQRGVRSESVLLVKGAHTPLCTPAFLDAQLRESLDRLQTDYADIYLMHRDNPDVPVGEFLDVLGEHHRAGRIRAFGGSNWTLPRLREMQEEAQRRGQQGFSCVSNNFSLARMIDPVWNGCVSANDPAFKAWLMESGTALLAWSSQARGFFTGRAHPDKRDDAELVRCWYSDDNFRRRERAVELAKKKGVDPINIALAYVLNQPFNSFALVGPRVIAETVSTLLGFPIALTPEEMAWLNLEA